VKECNMYLEIVKVLSPSAQIQRFSSHQSNINREKRSNKTHWRQMKSHIHILNDFIVEDNKEPKR
jgi:DUF971 family protein